MNSAMLLIVFLSTLCACSGAAISASNVTIEKVGSANEYCDIFSCPDINFDILEPSGNITTGFEFPKGYSENLCMTFNTVLRCGEANLEFQNNIGCASWQVQLMDFLRYFNSTFCQGPDLKDLEALRECANKVEVQVAAAMTGSYFAGSMNTISQIEHGYGFDVDFNVPQKVTTQLACSIMNKFVRRLGWLLKSECGNDAVTAFKKVTVKYIELMRSFGYKGASCPDLNIDDLFYGMRKKRSTEDFIFDMI